MNSTYKPMSLLMKVVLWFVVVNAYAGAISLILFPANTRSTFFWNITPPINAGMFGVLYLAAGSMVLQAALRGQWEPARYLTAMVPAFTGVMLLTTILHLDRFEVGFKLYYWLFVYVGAPLAGLIVYLQHERNGANWEVVSRPVARVVRQVAVITGVLAATFTVMVYIFPNLILGSWPWTISPLMTRVFLSWLSAFAVSLLWFHFDPDWSRLQPVATFLVASSVLMFLMFVIHHDDLKADSLTVWLFAVGIIFIGLLGTFMYWRQSEVAGSEGPRSVGKPRF